MSVGTLFINTLIFKTSIHFFTHLIYSIKISSIYKAGFYTIIYISKTVVWTSYIWNIVKNVFPAMHFLKSIPSIKELKFENTSFNEWINIIEHICFPKIIS
jgi:hypothetical protein